MENSTNQYKQALEQLPLSNDFTARTVEKMQQAALAMPAVHPRRRNKALALAVAAAAMLALVITASSLLHLGQDSPQNLSQIVLERSQGVQVSLVEKAPAIVASASLAALTEQEILGLAADSDAQLAFLYNSPIVRGEVTDMALLRLQVGTGDNYRALISLRVDECLRGDIEPGSTIRILLPGPTNGQVDGFWQEDMDIVGQLQLGSEAIFIMMAYDETSMYQQGSSTLYLEELAEYGLADGVRFAFIQQKEGVACAYDSGSFPSLEQKPQTLDEVAAYIRRQIAAEE